MHTENACGNDGLDIPGFLRRTPDGALVMSKQQIVEAIKAETLPAVVNPMTMLDQAVKSGAGLDLIERLMDLQDRWERNQQRKAFNKAISAAKAEIPPVVRNRTGHNNKKYADFAAIAKVVDPILSKHGLDYRFRSTQTDRISVTCLLSHDDGHCEENTLSGPPDKTGSKNDIQAIGSTLTYLQRYTLVQALGIAVDDDDDGKAAGSGGPLSDEQREQLDTLIRDTKSNIALLCKYVGVECLEDIPASKFDGLITMLNKKKAKPQ